MHETNRLGLPLLMPAQAQKHVTVNEAFARLDAAVQIHFSRSTSLSPPSAAIDGECFLVPADAIDEWKDAAGKIAVRSNGGWIFLTPCSGWTGWDVETARRLFFDGNAWRPEPQAMSTGGAATISEIIEFDHDVAPGTFNRTSVTIPAFSQVVAVTGRVKSAMEGNGLTGWRLGVEGSEDRYGSGIGLALNSYVVGLSGFPVTYYGETPLDISAEGGDFLRGAIRICVHLLTVRVPAPF
jgi:hypothetical protein